MFQYYKYYNNLQKITRNNGEYLSRTMNVISSINSLRFYFCYLVQFLINNKFNNNKGLFKLMNLV